MFTDDHTKLIEHVQTTNQAHLQTLSTRFAQLKQELHDLNAVVTKMEAVGDSHLLEDPEEVLIVLAEGATRFPNPIPAAEFDDLNSPFYEDARRRQQYLLYTDSNRFGPGAKEKEREAISTTVQNANMRIWAARKQLEGVNPLAAFNPNDPDMNFFLRNNLDDLDWDAIAQDYSSAVWPAQARTAIECKVAWRDGLRPTINREAWTREEDEKLTRLVQEAKDRGEDPPDWEAIATNLGTGRVALDCVRRVLLRHDKLKWTKELDQRLANGVERFGTQSWSQVALFMGGVSGPQCEARWRNRTAQVKGRWSKQEEAALFKAAGLFPANAISWTEVAQQIPGRTNTQCRDRYMQAKGKGTKRKSKARRKASSDDESEYEGEDSS